MSQAKYFNEITQQWEPLAIGGQGPQGIQGETGPGVAAGGTAGQILSKIDGTDYNTTWIDEAPAASYTSTIKHVVKLGESITKGQAVYVSSSNGTNMVVSKASNAGESTSSKTMGLAETGGSTNAQVNVITEGLLAGLNTSTATAGDPVWLGTSGNLIYGLASKPTAPAHLVFIGIVTRIHASQGEIFVRPQNGFELDELHDVSISSPAAGEIVVRNSANTLWENATLADAGVSAVGHTHDDRYYTETETNTLLSGKADSSHSHAASNITSGTFDYARIPSGTVIQAVTGTNTTQLAATGGWYDTGINVTITPRLATSRFIVMTSVSSNSSRGTGNDVGLALRILRNTNGGDTNILTDYSTYGSAYIYGGASAVNITRTHLQVNDYTGSGSAINYRVQGICYANSTSYYQYGGMPSTITVFEVAP